MTLDWDSAGDDDQVRSTVSTAPDTETGHCNHRGKCHYKTGSEDGHSCKGMSLFRICTDENCIEDSAVMANSGY